MDRWDVFLNSLRETAQAPIQSTGQTERAKLQDHDGARYHLQVLVRRHVEMLYSGFSGQVSLRARTEPTASTGDTSALMVRRTWPRAWNTS